MSPTRVRNGEVLKWIGGTLLACALLAIGSYTFLTRDDQHWRQKLVVTVSTPHGDVHGQAVSEVWMRKNSLFRDGARFQYTSRGEAVVVDLVDEKYLFILLSSRRSMQAIDGLISEIVAKSIKSQGQGWEDEFQNGIAKFEGPVSVTSDLYPSLVTFSDTNDPKSVKVIRPEDFSQVFGDGFSLKSMSVATTTDELDLGVVEKVLPWITTLAGGLVPTKMKPAADYKPEEKLGPYDFIRK